MSGFFAVIFIGLWFDYNIVVTNEKTVNPCIKRKRLLWKDYFTGLENASAERKAHAGMFVCGANIMRSAREMGVWIEREVALCFLEKRIRMSD